MRRHHQSCLHHQPAMVDWVAFLRDHHQLPVELEQQCHSLVRHSLTSSTKNSTNERTSALYKATETCKQVREKLALVFVAFLECSCEIFTDDGGLNQ